MVQPKTGNRNQDITAILCFAAGIVFFIWRAPYGFGPDDESWYITFSHRILIGDSLITDEWNVAQFIGFLLYLPVKLYIKFTHSTEGITLFFRYLFILFHGTVTAVTYWRLRHYGYISILAAIIFFLHVPWTIMALSYNSMGLGFVMLTGVILATNKQGRKITSYFVGLLFACAVVCNPPLALVYFLFSFFLVVIKHSEKLKRMCANITCHFLNAKFWLWLTVGISTVAVLFQVFIFSRTGLSDFFANFPYFFTDPEYSFTNDVNSDYKVFTMLSTLISFITLNKVLFFATFVSFLIVVQDKKRIMHRPLFLSMFCLIFVLYIIFIMASSEPYTYLYWMFPLVLFGLAAYILTEKKDRNIFIFIWLFGLVYAACLDISSAMGPMGAAVGFAVTDVASVLLIRNVLEEMKVQSASRKRHIGHSHRKAVVRTISLLMISALLFQIVQQVYIITDFDTVANEHFNRESREKKEDLNVTLQVGPQKGLITTITKAELYNNILSDISEIKTAPRGNVLITENLSWFYLYLDMPYATYSAWFYTFNVPGFILRLREYYKLHPDKFPEYIYISKIMGHNFNYEPVRAAMILEEMTKIIADNNYSFTTSESSVGYTLYTKKSGGYGDD